MNEFRSKIKGEIIYVEKLDMVGDITLASTNIDNNFIYISESYKLVLGYLISDDSIKVLQKIKDLAQRLSKYNFSEDLSINRKDEY
jgi:signal transduction histidine kinase